MAIVSKLVKYSVLQSAYNHDFDKPSKEGLFLARSLRALGAKLMEGQRACKKRKK